MSAPFVVDNKPSSIAPGSAGFILPPEQTFSALFNTPWHTWPRWADAALADSYDNMLRMRYDPVITNPLDVRARATVLQTWHIEPDDDNIEAEVNAAADIEWRIRRLPHFQQMLTTLLWDGIWVGRSAAQVYYKWLAHQGVTGLVPFSYDPVNGDKLIFGFGNKRDKVGIRVWAAYQGESELTDWGRVKWFDHKERANLLVHRHNREDADYTQWQLSGKIAGVGLRDRLYWTWANKNTVLAYLMDYLQWFSRGLTVYYYDANNAEAFAEVQNRVNEQIKSGLPSMLFPRYRDGGPGYEPVKRVEPGTAGNNMIMELVTGYFDDLFRRTILGQDGTTTPLSGGFNDGNATLHQGTFDNIVKWDSNNLQDSLTQDLVAVLYAYTYPNMPRGNFVFETESPNVEQLVQSAKTFVELGGTIDADLMRKDLGLPLPKPGGQLLGGMQAMQPAAVGDLPNNVPVVTPPGQDDVSTGPIATQDGSSLPQ